MTIIQTIEEEMIEVEADLEEEIQEEEVSEGAEISGDQLCTKQHVQNAEMIAKCRFNQQVIDRYTVAIVLKVEEKETAIQEELITEISKDQISKKDGRIHLLEAITEEEQEPMTMDNYWIN